MGKKKKETEQQRIKRLREQARKGGLARAKNLTASERSSIGVRAGLATRFKRGLEHYAKMAALRHGIDPEKQIA